MIEPTVEQIEAQFAEAVFVLSTTRLEDGPAYWALHRRIATALARRALEAEAPFIAVMTAKPGDELAGYRLLRKDNSQNSFGWYVELLETGAGGFISLPNLIGAIRALRDGAR